MRAAPIAAVALVLTGCAFTSAHLGSNAAVAPAPEAQAMAADSLVELVKLYPPAISRLAIDASASDDAFGQALTDGLRKRGYAVVEGARGAKVDPSAVPLRYVVDQPMTGYYRVMLRVGAQSLTRGYTTEGGVAPSAGWALNLSGASEQLVERATRPDLPPDAEQVQAELAAVDAGVAPQAALVPAAASLREPSYSVPASVVTVPVPPATTYAAQQAVDARGAEIAAADAQVRQMAAKVARYQAELNRAKARRAAAVAGWRVQFAAFRTERVARQYWRTLVAKRPTLAALSPRFSRSTKGMTFVQAGPYRTVAFAKSVCGGLKATACIVVKA